MATPLDAERTQPAAPPRNWKAAFAASCILHAAVAAVLLATFDASVLIEGVDPSGIVLFGNAPDDQQTAGDIADGRIDATTVTLVKMLDPKPVETVEARTVAAVETLQPSAEVAVETPVAETLEPRREAAEPPARAEKLEPVSEATTQPSATTQSAAPDTLPPSAVADAMPEMLTTAQPAATGSVVQPMEAAPVEAVEPTDPAPNMATKGPVEPMSGEAGPIETIEAVAGEGIPVPTPKPVDDRPQKVSERPASPTRERPAKKVAKSLESAISGTKAPVEARKAAKAGSGGRNAADTRRGVGDGKADGRTVMAGKGGKRSSAGNAAVSNYPGKVAARLRRAARGISRSARGKARNDVQVSFVIAAAGGVGSVRVTRSSGSPDLDQAALAVVRRAAPFPPIPSQAGRLSWAFSLPLGAAR